MNIHIARDGVEIGTYSDQDLRKLFDGGSFLITDLGWHEGLSEWIALPELLQQREARKRHQETELIK